MSEYSVQTADDNGKYTSPALQLTLALYIFKLRSSYTQVSQYVWNVTVWSIIMKDH